MGFVGDLLGFGGSGMNFRADSANIIDPVSQGQVNQSMARANSGLAQQQDFLRALQGQNGISNQSNVFNQQQALANQLQGVANGTGPNPALQQFQNATGQNVAQQAALMGSQRGSNANVGLLARQIGQNGANIQQNAVGQSAALQAQQQLAGMNALQNQQQLMGGMANQQVGQQAAALQGLNQGAQSQQNSLLGALNQSNVNHVNMQSNMNSANAGIAQTTAQGQQSLFGGLLGGVGSALAMARGGMVPEGYAHGGMARCYEEGGEVADNSGPASFAGKWLKGWTGSQSLQTNPLNTMGANAQNSGAQAVNTGAQGVGKDFGMGLKGIFSSLTSSAPAAIPMAGDFIAMGAKGGQMMVQGGGVPGKASVKGDSLKNDVVPAMLSPGEVVIPRHVMQSEDPVKGAAAFVAAVMAKKGRK